jgi:hypothetical protein
VLAHHLLLPRRDLHRLFGLPAQLQLGCICPLSADKPLSEQHMAGCAKGGYRTERHNRVVKLLEQLARCTGYSNVRREPVGLRGYGERDRPDLMFRNPDIPGQRKTVIVDVAVSRVLPNPTAAEVRKAIEKPLHKALQTEKRKINENAKRMGPKQQFVPFVFQSTGGYTRKVAGLMRMPGLDERAELPTTVRERLYHPFESNTGLFRLRMVMAVVKGTANNMLKLVDEICNANGAARVYH